jgi:hypothetical protein
MRSGSAAVAARFKKITYCLSYSEGPGARAYHFQHYQNVILQFISF